jgi:uncharacterized coiled-coil protein SlyX
MGWSIAWPVEVNMDLLNKLNRQVSELWQKHADCKEQLEKRLLLKRYKEVFSQYVKHKEWLKTMDA